jgi:protein kinase A
MPSLSKLLGKKRTKDSSGSNNNEETPTSPIRDTQQTQTQTQAAPTQPTTIDGAVAKPEPQETAVDPSTAPHKPQDSVVRPEDDSMTSVQSYPSPATYGAQTPQGGQSQQTTPSIQNLLNDDSKSANGSVQQPTSQQSRTTKGKYTLTDFTIQRTLGTGSFGRVHLVQSKHNQRFYAIKVLKKAQVVKMKQVEHTNDERRMLQKVKHPFLITLWGTFQDSKNLYMVMDFVEGGELFSLLRKSQVCCISIIGPSALTLMVYSDFQIQ